MEPRVIPRPDHGFSRSLIDPDVVKILYRLHNAGYQAYVVGGAVRDILRGELSPKDFDVATDATPGELRDLFRNSRTIGRRFRLVHVFFGDKNIEVATLRRAVLEGASADAGEAIDEGELYLDDDNLWGDVESDAMRRDFTVNGLFYSIDDFSIIDHVGGVDDIEAGLIRSIGDPLVRFREDPVRMLRAIKFAARFGFTIDDEADAAMRELVDEIHVASTFRVTEEFFRILSQRNGARGLELLREYGFLDSLFPSWVDGIGDEGYHQVHEFITRADHEAAEGRFLPLEVLTAGLFLPILDSVDVHHDRYHEHAERVGHEIRELTREMDIPKRLATAIVALLRGQLYMLFNAHRPKCVKRFVQRPEFDWVWRLHEQAFGDIQALHPLQEVWLLARERLPHAIDGWIDRPDRRDIFSFRGRTGGGRRDGEEPVTVLEQGQGSPRPPSRSGGRRRRRRRH